MTEKKVKKRKYIFPDNFLWGTSTSSHQIEGNNENNWTEWEKKGHIQDGSVSGRACNSFELYKEDIRLCRELKNNAYRLSIEWSRIEPEQGKFDVGALDHYKKMIQYARKNGIEPIVTLYHWTQPLWFTQLGGWRYKHAPLLFRRYTEKVAKKLGSSVVMWCTINEPLVYSYNSYLKGKWPPQGRSFFVFLKVIKQLVKAHRMAYTVLHDENPHAKVSIAKNNQYFEPYVNTIINRIAVNVIRSFWNHSFLRKIKDELDYIGVNYYFHNLIYFSGTSYVLMNENKQTTDMNWEIYPKGIYHVLKELKSYNLPVYILENGLADATDTKREDFIKDHLRNIHKAIKEGVDVRGYCHWSLLDNFEWSEGFEPKFGLYKVNLKTFERKPRPSATLYTDIAKNNGF